MPIPRIRPYSFEADTGLADNVTSWRLEPRRAVLLVHDMQSHFVSMFDRTAEPVTPSEAPSEVPSAAHAGQLDVAIESIGRLARAARRGGVPVVYTAQPPAQRPVDRALLTDFWGPGPADRQATGIIPQLAPDEGDTVLTKWRYSAFYRSDLGARMAAEGRDQLVITGVYAHIGCLTTALVAFMEGIQVFFVADAMADFGRDDHVMAARYVARRCGQVAATEAVLLVLRGADPDQGAAAFESAALGSAGPGAAGDRVGERVAAGRR